MFDDHNDDNDDDNDVDPATSFILMIKVGEEDEGSKERERLKLDEWWRERMEIMAIIWFSDGGYHFEMDAKGKQSFQPTFFRMFLGPI